MLLRFNILIAEFTNSPKLYRLLIFTVCKYDIAYNLMLFEHVHSMVSSSTAVCQWQW